MSTIKEITQSGFYKLSEMEASEIQVKKDISVCFFDEGNINKEIIVGENVKLVLCGFLENEEDYAVKVIQTGEKSQVEIKYMLLSQDGNKTKAQIYSKLQSNHSKSDVNIISFAGENGNIDIDGVIELSEGYEKMSGHLLEDNIFLGEKAKIRGIPTLLVASNDVEASHACKIHKISDEKLFYLRSRGIEKQESLEMILQAKFEAIFGKISKTEEVLYDDLKRRILRRKNGKEI